MKNKIIGLVFAVCLIVPAVFLFSACGGKQDYNVTFEIDKTKVLAQELSQEGAVFKSSYFDNFRPILQGYDIYDYSNFDVLINGVSAKDRFTKNYQDTNTYIMGAKVNLGELNLSGIGSDVKVTFTGIEEKPIKIAFLLSDDERLGNQATIIETSDLYNYNEKVKEFGNSFRVKFNQIDFETLSNMYTEQIQIGKDTNSKDYTKSNWLFVDDKNKPMYVDEDEIQQYEPYFFTFNASEFFNPISQKCYKYVYQGISSTSDFPQTNLPNGTITYIYDEYNYNNVGFNMYAENGFGYYSGITASHYRYNNTYEGQENTSIAGNFLNGNITLSYSPLFSNSQTAQDLQNQSSISFNLYPENLIVFDVTQLDYAHIEASLMNLSAILENDFGTSSAVDLGAVNTSRTFKIIDLGVTGGDYDYGIDFSNARVMLNGIELTGNLGSYQYVPADLESGIAEHFVCTLNAGILPISTYTKEEILSKEFYLDNQFRLTMENIDFSNATNVSKIKISSTMNDYTGGFVPIYNQGADWSLMPIYQLEENGDVIAYVANESKIFGDEFVLNNLGAFFIQPFIPFETKNQKVTVKKDNDVDLTIDVIAKVKAVVADEAVGNVTQEGSDLKISWQENGYNIIVSFTLIDNTENSIVSTNVQSIEIYTTADNNVSVWEFSCDSI